MDGRKRGVDRGGFVGMQMDSPLPESLEAMVERVCGFQRDSVPDESPFGYPPGLAQKVDPATGSFKGFFGSTVIARVSPQDAAWMGRICADLYEAMGGALAERLCRETLHLTICDLWSSPVAEQVSGRALEAIPPVSAVVSRARGGQDMAFTVNAVFNLMNTSVCLGLVPASRDDHEAVMSIRRSLADLVPVPAFTPHITLAYYRGDSGNPLDPGALRDWLERATACLEGREIIVHAQDITLALFTDMNSYFPLAEPALPQRGGR